MNLSQAFWWQLRSCFEYVNLRPSVKGLIVNTCLEVRAIQDKIIIRLSSKNLNKIPRENNVIVAVWVQFSKIYFHFSIYEKWNYLLEICSFFPIILAEQPAAVYIWVTSSLKFQILRLNWSKSFGNCKSSFLSSKVLHIFY